MKSGRDRALFFVPSVLVLLVTLNAFGADEPPLPVLSAEELNSRQNTEPTHPLLGGFLWPRRADGSTPHEVPEHGAADAGLADSPYAAQPRTDLNGFLLPGMRSQEAKPSSHPTPLSRLRPTSGSFHDECYAASPSHYLLDPSYQLSELEREDFDRFLNYHAKGARVRAYVLVLAKDQKLSAELDLSRVAGGSLGQNDACLLVYPLDEPHRARMFFTSSVPKEVSVEALEYVLADCLQEAQTTDRPQQQLHKLLVRLSIRLFQLQQQMPVAESPPAAAELTGAAEQNPKPAALQKAKPMPLREVAGDAQARAGGLAWGFLRWSLLIFALAALGMVLFLRWRGYRQRHYEWILPLPEMTPTPRLGGVHSGGHSSVVFFGTEA